MLIRFLLPNACLVLLALAQAGCGLLPPGKKTHYQQGIEAYDKARYEEAALSFGLAVKEDKNHGDAWFNQGLSLLKAGRFAEAAEIYRAFLNTFPASAEAHINLAFAQDGLGDPTGAVTHFQRALALDGTRPYPFCSYARFLLDRNEEAADREAWALLEQAVAIAPKDSTSFFLHGLAAERLDRADRARHDFQQAVNLDPFNQPALVRLGFYRMAEHRFEPAVKLFIRASVLDDRDPEAFFGAGRCFRMLHRYESALNALWQAQSLDPDNPETEKELVLTALYLFSDQISTFSGDADLPDGIGPEELEEVRTLLQRLKATRNKIK